MQSSKTRVIVPHGLRSLLEGVSQAVLENNPDDVAEFIALYFQEFIAFREENPNLDVTELVEKFEFVSEYGNEELEEKTSKNTDTLLSGEPKQLDKCTATEEDELLEEPDTQYSSKVTQHPSIASSIAESKFSFGSDGPSSPEGPELVYVPAEPAQLAAHVLATAAREAGQPPPPSNVWTLYCLTDLRQGQESQPSLPLAGAGGPCSQAALSLSRGQDQQCGQLSQRPAPIYVMQEASKKGNAPPFILVGSNMQNTENWKPVPGHAVFAQQDAGARRRFTTVPVPVARPADEETDSTSPSSNSAEEAGAQPRTLDAVLVAIPLDGVMSPKKGSPAADKHTGINTLAESYGTAG
ncbi:PREDICTED: calcium-binding tyrosine phosphorylation-regulated protein [Tauraco erythrolophus]|uniref:calcium-binding tyrosine phosphorylation-regulated protein n=1 Tax=Tauraco erythrolophus TaxID=121530 RepID=UPI000523E8EA|nr:PREDICTED: calcium-binding tyrosine phosphorylation-regulated protein [Tauraco erythrolophus]